MKGHVLGHDPATQATVLRGEDGQRYRFSSFEWREETSPQKGEEVDFEPLGSRARDVYRLAEAAPVEAGGDDGVAGPGSGETPARMLFRRPFMQFMMRRPVLPLSLLVLIACLFTAYTMEGTRLSLIAAPELAWRMSMAIDGLLAGSGADPGPRLAGAAARIATVILPLLYVVPALAALAAWREFAGRPDNMIARLAGIAAMTLPIALPALVIIVVRAGVLPGVDVPLRLGRDGASAPADSFHPIALYSIGTVLIASAGFGLWAAATDRLVPWLSAAAKTGISPSPAGACAASVDVQPEAGQVNADAMASPDSQHKAASAGTGWQGPLPDAGRKPRAGPSREAMTALTERLRLAIPGNRPVNPADRARPMSEEEVATVYAPAARKFEQSAQSRSMRGDQEAGSGKPLASATAETEERHGG